ncbi:helix-turn-helix domain-containing protein [Rhodococcus hoagii]|nr:helix-turn-helix domain-containing protein [Prescottella equi]
MADERGRFVMRRPLRGFDPVRLRLTREGAKISRAELARLTGVGPSTYSQWELGTAYPRPDSLARCAFNLGINMDDLFVIPLDQAYLGDLRVRRGFLQKDLAERLGVSEQLVGSIERGQGGLSDELAERWAEALSHDLPFRDERRRDDPIAVEAVRAAYERVRNRKAHERP